MDGYGTYPYTRDLNKRNRLGRVSARFQRQIVPDEDAEVEAEVEEEIGELESDEDTEPQQKDQTERKGDDRGSDSEGEGTEQSRHRQRRRDLSVPIDAHQGEDADEYVRTPVSVLLLTTFYLCTRLRGQRLLRTRRT
jgi:hypothetical protein